MKLVDVKKKIREHVTKERVVAFVGFAVGTAGIIVADYYRRENAHWKEYGDYYRRKNDKYLGRNPNVEYIDIPRGLMDDVRDGAVLKLRQKSVEGGSYQQTTTLDNFSAEADALFENWTPSEW